MTVEIVIEILYIYFDKRSVIQLKELSVIDMICVKQELFNNIKQRRNNFFQAIIASFQGKTLIICNNIIFYELQLNALNRKLLSVGNCVSSLSEINKADVSIKL